MRNIPTTPDPTVMVPGTRRPTKGKIRSKTPIRTLTVLSILPIFLFMTYCPIRAMEMLMILLITSWKA